MEQNTDRMWWTIGSVVLGGILIAGAILLLKTTVLPNIKTKIDDLDRSAITNKQDVTHTAYAWSEDGKDRFTTTKPNLNLLDGTKDFSGNWANSGELTSDDGTYKGLTVKKRTHPWQGIFKTFTAPKDGKYTFSAHIKSSGDNVNIYRFVFLNGKDYWNAIKIIGNNFDWLRDSFTINLKANDTVIARYELSDKGSLWTAGHKWEEGSTATPYMPSASEVKPSDQPKYIGTYTDKSKTDSQDPNKYTWKLNPDYHE